VRRVCKICGVPEDQHHTAEWREQPDGCVCDPLEWDVDAIPPACDEYQGDGKQNCTRCEHDKACHTARYARQ